MKTARHVTGLLLTTLLLVSGASTYAEDAEQHFSIPLDGKAGHPMLATMLEASKVGCFYRIQPATSEVRFSIDSKFMHVDGKFTQFKGGIALNPVAGDNNQTLFVVKSNSVSTSNAIVEKVIKSELFFDVEHFPEMLFVSTGFSWLSETRGFLKGKLTIHGVTKAVTLNVELSDLKGHKVNNDETILVKIDTSISRSTFGMHSMTSMVSNRVKLGMTIHAEKCDSISEEQLVSMSHYSR